MKYRIVLSLALAILLLAGALFLYYHSPKEQYWLVCVIYKLTGWYCPGCGSGRACYSILHWDFYQAFRFNPLMVILLPWMAILVVVTWGEWLVKGEALLYKKIPMAVLYGIIIALLIYMILRNINVYPFNMLAPTMIGA